MQQNGKPNILIVVVDTARADHLSCYGYSRRTSPNIDRMAAEGCRFERAITAAPFSPASYASLISNLYPHQHGVNGDSVRRWPDDWARLPERLREHDYTTFCVSNNSFVSEALNGARGFDRFQGPRANPLVNAQNRAHRLLSRHFGERVARRFDNQLIVAQDKGDSMAAVRAAQHFILDAEEQPFFGLVILMDPHAMFHPRRQEFAANNPHVAEFLRNVNGRQMWARVMAGRTQMTPERRQAALDLFDGEILHADRCVGALCDWLRATGRLDNTVLAICSDHGEAFGERGVWGHGFCLNDCLTRVPLILRHTRYWPAGSQSSALVQLHDLHDLSLSLAVDGTPDVDRHPHCLTQAYNPKWKGRTHAFSEFPVQTQTLRFMRELNPAWSPGHWEHDMWSVRTLDWRYIAFDDGACELYDLIRDPGETRSVHAERPEECRELHTVLEEHRIVRRDPAVVSEDASAGEVDESVLERLRALGYMD